MTGKRKCKYISICIVVLASIIFSMKYTFATQQYSKGYFVAEIPEVFEGIDEYDSLTPYYTDYVVEPGIPTKDIKSGISADNIIFKINPYQKYEQLSHNVGIYFLTNECPFTEEGVYRYILTPTRMNPEFVYNEENYIMDIHVGIVRIDKWKDLKKDEEGNYVTDENGKYIIEEHEDKYIGIKAVFIYNKDGNKITSINGTYQKGRTVDESMDLMIEANFRGAYESKPEKVVVSIYQCENNKSKHYRDVILSDENGWMEYVQVQKKSGNTIYQYYIEQNDLKYFKTTYSTESSLSNPIVDSDYIEITNTYSVFEFTIQSLWLNDEEDMRRKYTIDIYRNDTNEMVESQDIEASEETKVVKLANYINNISVKYYIKLREEIPKYSTNIDKANSQQTAVNEDASITITNTCNVDIEFNLNININWLENGSKNGLRPSDFQVEIYQEDTNELVGIYSINAIDKSRTISLLKYNNEQLQRYCIRLKNEILGYKTNIVANGLPVNTIDGNTDTIISINNEMQEEFVTMPIFINLTNEIKDIQNLKICLYSNGKLWQEKTLIDENGMICKDLLTDDTIETNDGYNPTELWKFSFEQMNMYENYEPIEYTVSIQDADNQISKKYFIGYKYGEESGKNTFLSTQIDKKTLNIYITPKIIADTGITTSSALIAICGFIILISTVYIYNKKKHN